VDKIANKDVLEASSVNQIYSNNVDTASKTMALDRFHHNLSHKFPPKYLTEKRGAIPENYRINKMLCVLFIGCVV
jgi:hypothetical protein